MSVQGKVKKVNLFSYPLRPIPSKHMSRSLTGWNRLTDKSSRNFLHFRFIIYILSGTQDVDLNFICYAR